MLRPLRLSLLLAAACGPTLPGTTDATDSTGDAPSTGDGTLSAGTGSTGVDPTTGASDPTTSATTGEPGTTTTTTTGTTGPDTTGTGTTGGDACGAIDDEEVQAQWSLEFPGGGVQQSLSADCTVEKLDEPAPGSATIALACEADVELAAVLTYTRTPVQPPPLAVGEQIRLEYREDQIFWTNRWFSIRAADTPTQMKFGGISGSAIEPLGATVEEFFFTPLAVVEGACEPSGDGVCGPEERLGLAVPFGSPSPVFDGQFRQVVNLPGHYDVWLATARRPTSPDACDDVPPAWFEALLFFEVSP